MKKVLSTSLVFAGLMVAAGAANAADICKPHEKGSWLTREDATKKIMELGYEVKTIVDESGCWKITGAYTGKEVVGYFDPVTADPIDIQPLKK